MLPAWAHLMKKQSTLAIYSGNMLSASTMWSWHVTFFLLYTCMDQISGIGRWENISILGQSITEFAFDVWGLEALWDLFHSFYFWNSCSQPSLQYITFVSTSTQCESLNEIWDKHKNLLIFVCTLLFDARPCPSGNQSSLERKAVCMLSIIILLFHPLNSWSDWTKEVASVYEPITLLEDDHTTAGKPMFWQNIRWLRKNTEIFLAESRPN